MGSPELARARAMYEDLLQQFMAKGEDATVDYFRETYEAFSAQFPIPGDARIEMIDAGGVPAVTVTAEGASTERMILYLHGGGYVIGSANGYRSLGAALSQATDARVVLLDYRLAPENPYPASVEDATAAYRWLLKTGTPASEVILCGDSAGGGLVAATLLALRDAGDPLPAGGVMISPWTDLALTGESLDVNDTIDPLVKKGLLVMMAEMYLVGADPKTPLASPLYGDYQGVPPLLIIAGDAETLRDDAVRVAERARATGVSVTLNVVPDQLHIFPVFSSFMPEARQALEEIGAFVKQCTG
ncbi:MAG: alpha/beta hydrolase [Actinomycetota bacterium]|jgi:epsilon-lactone hydrolase